MAGLGPSSNVSATAEGSPVCRTVGPKSCEDGATAPHAKTAAAAAKPAPTLKPGTEFIRNQIFAWGAGWA